MTFEELNKIKKNRLDQIAVRFEEQFTDRYSILVCSSTGCDSSHCGDVFSALKSEVEKLGLGKKCEVVKVDCFGFCVQGPVVVVCPGDVFYCKVKKEDAKEIVSSHIKSNKVVDRLVFHDQDGKLYRKMMEIPFYNNQKMIARLNAGKIDPNSLEDYIAVDGYQALFKILKNNNPQAVVDEITKSGLRGRGGAGFPTGKKWQFAKDNESLTKFVICNGDEGDPGAFMDRSIIEGNPHCIIEAMAIAGFAIGAKNGIVYVRAEYPIASKRIKVAIEQARNMGLLGTNIFDTGFDFDIDVKLGAGAFVCGEETSLIKSCEGKRGEPYKKPPYPAEKGCQGFPTIINNVETLANIPTIIRNGYEWFEKFGTESSKGTKVFSVTGKVKNTGLVELPMGMNLRDVVFGMGGGILNDKKFKGVQMGGPSGGCVCEKDLDTKIDYENLKNIGTMMGSGGMIVLDDSTCMVDLAKFFLEFTCDESCGKCTPCRIGNRRLLEILTKICDGKGEMKDLAELEDLSKYIKNNSLCGLGQTSPNPVLSTLEKFRDEYVEHVKEKKCRAGVCKKLIKYEINQDKCVGCSMCARNCPVSAISGQVGKKYLISQEICVKCGKCFSVCKFNAVEKK